jgi:hypothetical protein
MQITIQAARKLTSLGKWLSEISVKIPIILLNETFPTLYQRLPANSGI